MARHDKSNAPSTSQNDWADLRAASDPANGSKYFCSTCNLSISKQSFIASHRNCRDVFKLKKVTRREATQCDATGGAESRVSEYEADLYANLDRVKAQIKASGQRWMELIVQREIKLTKEAEQIVREEICKANEQMQARGKKASLSKKLIKLIDSKLSMKKNSRAAASVAQKEREKIKVTFVEANQLFEKDLLGDLKIDRVSVIPQQSDASDSLPPPYCDSRVLPSNGHQMAEQGFRP